MLFHKGFDIVLSAYKVKLFVRNLHKINIRQKLFHLLLAAVPVMPDHISVVDIKADQLSMLLCERQCISDRFPARIIGKRNAARMEHSAICDIRFLHILFGEQDICTRFSGKRKRSFAAFI